MCVVLLRSICLTQEIAMKSRLAYTAAGIVALSALVAAVSSEPTQAQSGGRWVPAGAYNTDAGGEVWMVNTETGVARNCFWQQGYSAPRCVNSIG
ncbi:hypothetical protein IP78_02045 [Brevundimonas sp. AAP58]|nr:hypothetical protein IP78_02045 [Brevundimonas sp. AAP58]